MQELVYFLLIVFTAALVGGYFGYEMGRKAAAEAITRGATKCAVLPDNRIVCWEARPAIVVESGIRL